MSFVIWVPPSSPPGPLSQSQSSSLLSWNCNSWLDWRLSPSCYFHQAASRVIFRITNPVMACFFLKTPTVAQDATRSASDCPASKQGTSRLDNSLSGYQPSLTHFGSSIVSCSLISLLKWPLLVWKGPYLLLLSALLHWTNVQPSFNTSSRQGIPWTRRGNKFFASSCILT